MILIDETTRKKTNLPLLEADREKKENRSLPYRNKKGFAGMDPEKRRHAAAKGGKRSKGGGRIPLREPLAEGPPESEAEKPATRKRGFAGMDPEKRKAVSALGGRLSRGGGRPKKNKKDAPSGTARRGFAGMDPELRKRIAALGGKASQEAKRLRNGK